MSDLSTKKRGLPIKTIVAIGIGAALVVAIYQVSIPVGFIPNTRLQFNAAIIGLIGAIFGPVAGLFTGLISLTIGDAAFYGGIWWSWVIADGVYGALVGLTFKKLRISDGGFGSKQALIFNINQFLANALAWLLVAPVLDILIYAEPSDKVFVQGMTAFAANGAVTLIVGTILAFAYSRIRTGSSSLEKES